MKINSTTPSAVQPTKARQAGAGKSTPAVANTGTASVETHLQAGTLGTTAAPFDTQRVAEIRLAVSEGRFQIDANKIAGRLIDDVRELLAKDRPRA